MDTKVPGGTAALPWLVFPLYLFLQWLPQERLQEVHFDQGTKLVILLTLRPTVITGVSPAHIMCSSTLTYRYGEQNLFEVSNIQRKKERGKMPSNTCKAAHTWRWQQLLAAWQAWRMHVHHRGIGVVSTQIKKPLQSLSLQTNPWLQKCLLVCFIRPWQKYGAGDRVMRKEAKHYSQMTARSKCPRDGNASFWPNCKRVGKEKVQKWVREGKV